MQSLIEKANTGGHFEIVNNRQNWKHAWFTPTHSAPINSATSGADAVQLADGVSVEKYPFNFKTWNKTDECIWTKMLEANDSMDLLDASTYSTQDKASDGISNDQQTASRPTNGESLTAEDIRGAVGSVDGISGFSSSDAQAHTKEEPDQSSTVVSGQEQNHVQDYAKDQVQEHGQEQGQEQVQEHGQEEAHDQNLTLEQNQNLGENNDSHTQDQNQDQDVNMDTN